MAIVRFKAKGRVVMFDANTRKAKSKPARKSRRGPPKGKVPPQLRKYLFKKGRRSRR